MIDFEELHRSVGMMAGTMTHLPSDAESRNGIVEALAPMLSPNEQTAKAQLEWLRRRMPELFTKWPGVREVRAVFCSRFPPADRVTAESEKYPEGIPPSREFQETRLVCAADVGPDVRRLLGEVGKSVSR